MTLSIMALSIMAYLRDSLQHHFIVTLSVFVLSVVMMSVVVCNYAECLNVKCRYGKCRGAIVRVGAGERMSVLGRLRSKFSTMPWSFQIQCFILR